MHVTKTHNITSQNDIIIDKDCSKMDVGQNQNAIRQRKRQMKYGPLILSELIEAFNYMMTKLIDLNAKND